jgi:hypothetical protein
VAEFFVVRRSTGEGSLPGRSSVLDIRVAAGCGLRVPSNPPPVAWLRRLPAVLRRQVQGCGPCGDSHTKSNLQRDPHLRWRTESGGSPARARHSTTLTQETSSRFDPRYESCPVALIRFVDLLCCWIERSNRQFGCWLDTNNNPVPMKLNDSSPPTMSEPGRGHGRAGLRSALRKRRSALFFCAQSQDRILSLQRGPRR